MTRNPWNLTAREAQVMDAVCEHGQTKLIAQQMSISPATVDDHRKNANNKMGAAGALAAVRWDRFRNGRKNG